MGWREQLRKASYAGLDFLSEDVTNSIKRQSTSYSIPNGQFPIVQDSGIGDRPITINAYFIGDNYITERNFLESLLRNVGGEPQELILPTRNAVKVKVVDWQTKWSNQNGGMETITINFVEVSSDIPRIFDTTTKDKVFDDGNVVEIYTSESFEENVDLKKKPSFVSDDMFNRYKEFAKTASKYTDLALSALDEIAKFKTDPLGYIGGVVDTLGGVSGTFSDLRGSYFALKGFVGFVFSTSDDYSDTNSARRVQKQNATELDLAVTNIAVQKMAETAIGIDYTSRKDAVEIRDDMVEQFDFAINQISDTEKNDMYDGMIALKASFIKYMNQNGASLPQVKEVVFDESLPSVFISNNEYGGVNLDDDLVTRNNVDNPLFMPQNTPIEVLVI